MRILGFVGIVVIMGVSLLGGMRVAHHQPIMVWHIVVVGFVWWMTYVSIMNAGAERMRRRDSADSIGPGQQVTVLAVYDFFDEHIVEVHDLVSNRHLPLHFKLFQPTIGTVPRPGEVYLSAANGTFHQIDKDEQGSLIKPKSA